MVLAVCRPWRHPASGCFWYRRRVPADLRASLARGEIRLTLGTREPAEARLRHAHLDLAVEVGFDRARREGSVAAILAPGHVSPYRNSAGDLDNGFVMSAAGHARIMTDDPSSTAPERPPAVLRPPELPLPLGDVFDQYAAAVGLSPATRKRWRPALLRLADFAGTDDARTVTADTLKTWKARLSEAGLAPVTVRDVYLASAKATLGWASEERMIPSNPAAGLRHRVPKPLVLRDKGFTDEEAGMILAATLAAAPERLSEENKACRCWVPWLLAYTGARVNEMTQLRPRDIRDTAGVAYLRITPEAGRVKNGAYRDVPLHPHLIEQGFLGFVASRGSRPLFYDPDRSKGSDQNPIYKRMGQNIAEWIRPLVPDEGGDPSHGWRHRFKTVGRRSGIPDTHLDAIQGHAPASVGTGYGSFPISVLHESMLRLPKYA